MTYLTYCMQIVIIFCGAVKANFFPPGPRRRAGPEKRTPDTRQGIEAKGDGTREQVKQKVEEGMKNAKQRTGSLLVALALLGAGGLLSLMAGGGAARAQGDDKLRADILSIDELKKFGPLTQPPVVFLHDKHTAALGKQKQFYKKECGTCHLSDKDGTMFLAYQRDDKPMDADRIKETFHANCIGCHKKMAEDGMKAGPTDVQCKGCHNGNPDVASNWQPLVVDKKLHYRHAATQAESENKCGACHHIYDEAAGKTIAAPAPEKVPGACVYCHTESGTDVKGRKPEKIRSLRLATHGECVTCHRSIAAAGGKDVATGPTTCAGCHGPLDQKAIAETSRKKVPADADLRIKRGQPDFALVRPVKAEKPLVGADGKPIKDYGMPPVPFDHKYHESKNETCVSCHHAALTSCAACHTPAGDEKGGYVPLEAAMHKVEALQSCAGCHAAQQKKPECAGCHASMKKGVGDVSQCGSCHVPPQGALEQSVAEFMERRDKDAAAMAPGLAEKLLAGKRSETATIAVEDIPETVTLGSLAKDYQPSVLPHRKIVLSLVAGMKGDKLAGAFHATDTTVCQGCHHMSPASKTPPRCGNCHPAVEGTAATPRPTLKAAYHNQCMNCHTAMGISGKVADKAPGAKPVPKSTDCTGCHAAKKN